MDHRNATLHCLTAVIAIFAFICLDCIFEISEAAQVRNSFFNTISAMLLVPMTILFAWSRQSLAADRNW